MQLGNTFPFLFNTLSLNEVKQQTSNPSSINAAATSSFEYRLKLY